jgi:hypothetical protein
MDGDTAGDQKYLRAALSNQYNVILMLGAVAFGVALASWIPPILGLVGEALWLFIAPRMARFRAGTEARLTRADNAKVLETLPPEYGQRAAGIESDAKEIESLCASRADVTPEQRMEVTRRLRPLVQTFVSVCATKQRLEGVASRASRTDLQTEVATLHQSLAAETDLGVRASLRRALSVAERRIRQLENSETAVRSLDVALQTLQQSFAMLKEGAAGLSSAPEICAELDAAASQLTRAAAVEAEQETELGAGRVSMLPPALS